VSLKLTLKTLQLDGFGCFGPKPLEVRFVSDRLNLVLGKNEAGKSTLVRAIFGILFGIKDSDEEQRSAPWHNGGRIYKGSLELMSGDREVHITRDFQTNHVQITATRLRGTKPLFNDAANPRSAKPYSLYLNVLRDLSILQDDELFYATTVIRQADLQVKMTDKLRQLISGAAESDYLTVQKRLKDLHDQLTVKRSWTDRQLRNPRKIDLLEQEIQKRQRSLSEVKSQLDRFATSKEEFDQLEQDLETLEEEINKGREELRRMDRLTELLREELRLRERLKDIQKSVDRIREMEEKKQHLERANQEQYPEFTDAPEDLSEQLQQLQRLDERCQHLKQDQARIAAQRIEVEKFLASAEQKQREQYARFCDKPDDFPGRLAANLQKRDALKNQIKQFDEKAQQCDQIFPAWSNLSSTALSLLERNAAKILSAADGRMRLYGKRREVQRLRQRQRMAAVLSLGLAAGGAVIGSMTLGPVVGILAGVVLGLVLFFVLSFCFAPRELLGQLTHHEQMLEGECEQARRATEELHPQLGSEVAQNPEALHRLAEQYQTARPILEEMRLLEKDILKTEDDAGIEGKGVKEILKAKLDELRGALKDTLEEIQGFETTVVDDAFRASWDEYHQLRETYRSKTSELKVLLKHEQEKAGELAEAEKQITAANARLSPILKGRSPDTVQRLHAEYRNNCMTLGALRDTLARDENLDDLKGERDDLTVKYDSLQRQLHEFFKQFPALDLWKDKPGDLQRERDEFASKIQHLEKEIDTKRRRRADVIAELRVCERVDQDVERLEEEIKEGERQLVRLDQRSKAIAMAIRMLDQCIGDYQEQYLQGLAEKIESAFTKIVGRRYRDFEFTENFDKLYFATAEAHKLTDASLSHGARDQLYFAMRLATAGELAAQVNLPFILDDPFVNFDHDRLQRLMDMLLRIAQTHQVILLTHRREYARWEVPILDLDEYQRENARWLNKG